MKKLLLGITVFYLSLSLSAQEGLNLKRSLQDGTDYRWNIELLFQSSPDRRYKIEVSEDLNEWDDHYLSPFEYSAESYWIRQLDMTNPQTQKNEFYRVSRLPWVYQTIIDTDDWIGDLSLSSSGDSALLVYQNRDTNELFFTESTSGGIFATPTVIASTGAIDEPGFWDNSGFAEVTLAHYSNKTFIACTDFISKKVIILWKDSVSDVWNRHEISGIIENHYWAFPKFSISSSGILGIAFANNSGTVFAFADHLSPESWTSIPVTDSTPNNSASIETVFSSPNDAHVYIRYGGSYKISTETNTVTSETFPASGPRDLNEEENNKIESAYRNESMSYMRLQNDRILIILSNSDRIVSAVEEQ